MAPSVVHAAGGRLAWKYEEIPDDTSHAASLLPYTNRDRVGTFLNASITYFE